MAQGVITKTGREKLCKAHAGDITLPAITQMAFGSGGVDESGAVIVTTGEEVSLRAELLKRILIAIPTRKQQRGAIVCGLARRNLQTRRSVSRGFLMRKVT